MKVPELPVRLKKSRGPCRTSVPSLRLLRRPFRPHARCSCALTPSQPSRPLPSPLPDSQTEEPLVNSWTHLPPLSEGALVTSALFVFHARFPFQRGRVE